MQIQTHWAGHPPPPYSAKYTLVRVLLQLNANGHAMYQQAAVDLHERRQWPLRVL